jgi:hypothetical protein
MTTNSGPAEFRVDPQVGLPAVVAAVTAAIRAARDEGDGRLLIDLRDVRNAPTLAQRHELSLTCARAAGGDVVIAVVAPPSFIDPDRFGVLVAESAGLHVDVFTEEADARAWLARQAAKRTRDVGS